MRKGDAGVVAVIGGSIEYTGAPYFAGISSMRAGADMVYVFCEPAAATPIKTYSPELIVFPWLDGAQQKTSIDRISAELKHTDVLVIGPGLSKKEEIRKIVEGVFVNVFDVVDSFVFDAYGIPAFTNTAESLDTQKIQNKVVLTPNFREIEMITGPHGKKDLGCASERLFSVCVLEKNETDTVYAYGEKHPVRERGIPRRCAGQGDILAGCLASLLVKHRAGRRRLLAAATEASGLVRRAARAAYRENGDGTIASDILLEIAAAKKHSRKP
ncbi:MAG: carbohydrate kinase domain family protein [Amphiamblys sp. WSBS2006]|nr:MAG: carbohydrate kinase domain family protein [Amphiamblys sp. WSBS2006]